MILTLTGYQVEWLTELLLNEQEEAAKAKNSADYDHRGSAALLSALRQATSDEIDDTPCVSEIWSWSRFSSDAVDPYWIRCGRLGRHDIHEDSNTGAKWTDEDAA